MFGIGFPELLLILAIALVILGPEKLPQIARAIGRGLGEVRRATEEVRAEIERGDPIRGEPIMKETAERADKPESSSTPNT